MPLKLLTSSTWRKRAPRDESNAPPAPLNCSKNAGCVDVRRQADSTHLGHRRVEEGCATRRDLVLVQGEGVVDLLGAVLERLEQLALAAGVRSADHGLWERTGRGEAGHAAYWKSCCEKVRSVSVGKA